MFLPTLIARYHGLVLIKAHCVLVCVVVRGVECDFELELREYEKSRRQTTLHNLTHEFNG